MLNLLNRHGLRIPTRHTPPHRKNPSMIKYFDQIDNHEKAYFLGLLYADGYICKSNYTYQMGIALQLQDKYIIEELYKELNLKTINLQVLAKNDIAIKLYEKNGFIFVKQNNNVKEYKLSIMQKHLDNVSHIAW